MSHSWLFISRFIQPQQDICVFQNDLVYMVSNIFILLATHVSRITSLLTVVNNGETFIGGCRSQTDSTLVVGSVIICIYVWLYLYIACLYSLTMHVDITERAQGNKYFLSSQVWTQVVTITIWPPRHYYKWMFSKPMTCVRIINH